MAVSIDINTFIQYGKISSYLARNDFARKKLFRGSAYNSDLPMRLEVATRLIDWKNSVDPNNDFLVDTGNYLYQLCGPYIQQAKIIIANMGQGLIVNPANGAVSTLVPIYLQFKVGVTSSPVNVNGVNVTLPTDGQSSITLPLTFILNSLEVIAGGVPLPQNDSNQLSFTPIYTNNDATITLFGGATFNNGELWVISGYQFVSV